MLVHFEDKDYTFDIEALDVSEARTIKRQTGLTIRALMNGLEEMDPDAMVALYWLMLKQNGQMTDPNKVNFPMLKFGEALADAFAAEQEAEEANPTEAEPAASQA